MTSAGVCALFHRLPTNAAKRSLVLRTHHMLTPSDARRLLPELVLLAESDSGGMFRQLLAGLYDSGTLSSAEPEGVCNAGSTAPCSECVAPSAFVRTQDRCRALCTNENQCNRRHLPGKSFCGQHTVADDAARACSLRVGTAQGLRQVENKETGYRPGDVEATYPGRDPFWRDTYRSGLKINRMDFATSGKACPVHELLLPVSRVDNLFFAAGSGPDEYIGKFYVYEPNSIHYLRLGNFRVFGTKVHAYSVLNREYQRRFSHRFRPEIVTVSVDQTLGLTRPRVRTLEARHGRYTVDDAGKTPRTPFTDYIALRTNLLGGYYPDAVAAMVSAQPLATSLPKTIHGWHWPSVHQHLRNLEVFFLSVFQREEDTCPGLLGDVAHQDRLYRSTYALQPDTNRHVPEEVVVPGEVPTMTVHPLFPSINPGNVPHTDSIDQFQYYDMPIGALARALGIDTLILQHEFLEEQSQTELFHVKLHADRFEDVCSIDSSRLLRTLLNRIKLDIHTHYKCI